MPLIGPCHGACSAEKSEHFQIAPTVSLQLMSSYTVSTFPGWRRINSWASISTAAFPGKTTWIVCTPTVQGRLAFCSPYTVYDQANSAVYKLTMACALSWAFIGGTEQCRQQGTPAKGWPLMRIPRFWICPMLVLKLPRAMRACSRSRVNASVADRPPHTGLAYSHTHTTLDKKEPSSRFAARRMLFHLWYRARSGAISTGQKSRIGLALRWSRLIEHGITDGTAFFSPRISMMVLFFCPG